MALNRFAPKPSRGDRFRSADEWLAALIAGALVLRVLTDDKSAPDSRSTGNINLSAIIAILFIAVAGAMLMRRDRDRDRGVRLALLSTLWLLTWMAVAVHTSGASAETLREGVREASVISLGLIVYNAQATVTVPVAARIVQLAALVPAVIALYQLGTHSGLEVAHNLRANGTFAHPNSAAVFFAIAAIVSIWLFLDRGRRVTDAALGILFAASLISTFSIDGLITLVTMLVTLGVLRHDDTRSKYVPIGAAILIVIVFVGTPLGAHRLASESTTSFSAGERGETTSTLNTRLYRWKTLFPQWEESPIYGRGLGTTTTATNTRTNRLNSLLPHNEYIRYLVETGIVGLLALMVALAILVRTLLRRRRVDAVASGVPANVSSVGISLVIGCLVNALADNTLLNSPTCYAIALVLASTLSISNDRRRDVDGLPNASKIAQS